MSPFLISARSAIMVLHVWNEDLLRAFTVRQRKARDDGKEVQHTFKKALVILQGIRADIRQRQDGHIMNLPDLGGVTMTQLAHRIISGAEQVVPADMVAYDPAATGENLREIVQAAASEHIRHFVRNKMKYREGSYAILMAMHEFGKKPIGAGQEFLTKTEFEMLGKNWMNGHFMPNFHAGVLRGVGWDSRETLKKNGFITEGKAGAGRAYEYRLTAQGRGCIAEIIQFYHDGRDPVTNQLSGAPAVPPGGAGGGASASAAAPAARETIVLDGQLLGTTPKEREVEQFVRDSLEMGSFPTSDDFRGTKEERKTIHRLVERQDFKNKYRAYVTTRSHGEGRGRKIAVTVQSGPAVVPSTSNGPPANGSVLGGVGASLGAPIPVRSDNIVSRSSVNSRLVSGGTSSSGGQSNLQQGARAAAGELRGNNPNEDYDEEAAIARAIQESLAGVPQPGAHQEPDRQEPVFDEPQGEDEDAELRRAIEESLRTSAPKAPPEAKSVGPKAKAKPAAKRRRSEEEREMRAAAAEKRFRTLSGGAAAGGAASSSAAAPRAVVSAGPNLGGAASSSAAAPSRAVVPAGPNGTSVIALDSSDEDEVLREVLVLVGGVPPRGQAVRASASSSAAVAPPPRLLPHVPLANGAPAGVCRPTTLVIDERERGTDAVPRELRNRVKREIAEISRVFSTPTPLLNTTVHTIPVSDFVWQRADAPAGGAVGSAVSRTDEILNLLVERKAVKDIVGRSAKDDQSRQLERMAYLNGADMGGVNILLIDGDPLHAKDCAAYGAAGQVSCWDPERRYYARGEGQNGGMANVEEGTAIVNFEHLFVGRPFVADFLDHLSCNAIPSTSPSYQHHHGEVVPRINMMIVL